MKPKCQRTVQLPFDTLEVKEIRELGRTGNHPFGWFLLETDALSYWVHLPHKDQS